MLPQLPPEIAEYNYENQIPPLALPTSGMDYGDHGLGSVSGVGVIICNPRGSLICGQTLDLSDAERSGGKDYFNWYEISFGAKFGTYCYRG
ncbi:hypothetical protein ACFX13_032128 [Malus domestica]